MTKIVTNNIKKRCKEIKEGKKTDIVTGLVIQGGGMRGVYSMSALFPLEECGLRDSFDHIFGTSAGAINGIYLLAGQAKDGVNAYIDDISNKNFVDFFRLRKVVDIDFLVDQVVKKKKALKVNNVKNTYTTMHIVLTDYSNGESITVTNKDEEVDLVEAIRATSAMPILYNKVVYVKGRGYIDGGVTDAIPLFRAIKMGCTDILVVLSRPPNFRKNRLNTIMRIISKLYLRKYPLVTKKMILSENKLYNETMEFIENYDHQNEKVRIAVVYPSDLSKMVSRTTNDRDDLLACALMARNDTRRLFGLKPVFDDPYTSKK